MTALPRATTMLGAVCALVYLVGSTVDFAVERASGWYAGSMGEYFLYQIPSLAIFLVGWLLILRRAGGPIGWLLVAQWALLALSGFAATYASYSYSPTS